VPYMQLRCWTVPSATCSSTSRGILSDSISMRKAHPPNPRSATTPMHMTVSIAIPENITIGVMKRLPIRFPIPSTTTNPVSRTTIVPERRRPRISRHAAWASGGPVRNWCNGYVWRHDTLCLYSPEHSDCRICCRTIKGEASSIDPDAPRRLTPKMHGYRHPQSKDRVHRYRRTP
jgi:hypothetical protein